LKVNRKAGVLIFFFYNKFFILYINQVILFQVQSRDSSNNGKGARGKKPLISDTSYSSLIRGPVATVGSVGVEGVEGGEERKELDSRRGLQ
jgi:hypothetical protein